MGMAVTGEYEPGAWDWAAKQVEEFEASNGASGSQMQGVAIVVVTMLGAKSGKVRKVPVMRVEHDGAYAAVASKGGAPEHPSWYHNLLANPVVDLQDGPDKRSYRARLVTGEERSQWWARSVAAWPAYEEYQTKTNREIPVFVLEPVEG